ncbi:methionyl-tRNA formyltransferase [Allomuricauda sp. d1]|uniref:methionyl-tRNA formyltransferase n=1 Tax=Allomuricauda sp. d1 TaxID=3136725 RepID=UPI0031CDD821
MPTKSKNSKRDLRIVFMGTPDFAVKGLDVLLNNGYQVVGVITAPDRPAGRGHQLNESAVKKYALKNGLTILQPTNLKDAAFLEQLKSLNANLFVVVAFRMLPMAVWQMPEYGTFNLHASLLPQYRGAAPINWAIINGETETGVTTFFIDEKIDTGEIILQEKTAIGSKETAGELHDRLMQLGAELIVKTVQLIETDTVQVIPQSGHGDLKPAPKIDKETCNIDWNADIKAIFNHIRGLSPYPTAWTILVNGDEEISMKIYEVDMKAIDHDDPVGKVHLENRAMKVAVKGGFIYLKKVQLQGKRMMPIEDVLNGFRASESICVR